jgi:hypothetical protein
MEKLSANLKRIAGIRSVLVDISHTRAFPYTSPDELRTILSSLLPEGDVDSSLKMVLADQHHRFLILPEGSVGVWSGFSSAEHVHGKIGGPLYNKIDEDEVFGDGDPVFYLTVGNTGEVKGKDQTRNPLPMYEDWKQTQA